MVRNRGRIVGNSWGYGGGGRQGSLLLPPPSWHGSLRVVGVFLRERGSLCIRDRPEAILMSGSGDGFFLTDGKHTPSSHTARFRASEPRGAGGGDSYRSYHNDHHIPPPPPPPPPPAPTILRIEIPTFHFPPTRHPLPNLPHGPHKFQIPRKQASPPPLLLQPRILQARIPSIWWWQW